MWSAKPSRPPLGPPPDFTTPEQRVRQLAQMYGVEHILRDPPSKPRIVGVNGYPWDEMPWERDLREANELRCPECNRPESQQPELTCRAPGCYMRLRARLTSERDADATERDAQSARERPQTFQRLPDAPSNSSGGQ